MKIIRNSLKKAKGFTLTEVVIVLVIIGIIAVASSKIIGPAKTEFYLWLTTNQGISVHNSANSWQENGVYTGVSMAVLNPDYIADDIGDGVGVNPFNGDITTNVNAADAFKQDVIFSNVTDKVGARAIRKMGVDNAAYAAGVLTLTYGGT